MEEVIGIVVIFICSIKYSTNTSLLIYQIQKKNHLLSSSTWVLLYLQANTPVTGSPHFTDSNNAAFITMAIWRQSVDLLENRGWKNAASPLVGPDIFPKSWL